MYITDIALQQIFESADWHLERYGPRLGVLLSLLSPRPLGVPIGHFGMDGSPIRGSPLASRTSQPLGVPIGHFRRDGSPMGVSSRSRLRNHSGVPMAFSEGWIPRFGGSPLAPISATTRECQLGILGDGSPIGGSPLAPISATTRECQLGILGGWIPDWGVLLCSHLRNHSGSANWAFWRMDPRLRVLLSLQSPRPLRSANWAFWEMDSPIGGSPLAS